MLIHRPKIDFSMVLIRARICLQMFIDLFFGVDNSPNSDDIILEQTLPDKNRNSLEALSETQAIESQII